MKESRWCPPKLSAPPPPADAYLAVYGVPPRSGEEEDNGFSAAGFSSGRSSRNGSGVAASASHSAEANGLHSADGARRMLALAQAMHSICAVTRAPDGSGPIRIRVGLHVGPAIAAVVGTQMLRCAARAGNTKLPALVIEHRALPCVFIEFVQPLMGALGARMRLDYGWVTVSGQPQARV